MKALSPLLLVILVLSLAPSSSGQEPTSENIPLSDTSTSNLTAMYNEKTIRLQDKFFGRSTYIQNEEAQSVGGAMSALPGALSAVPQAETLARKGVGQLRTARIFKWLSIALGGIAPIILEDIADVDSDALIHGLGAAGTVSGIISLRTGGRNKVRRAVWIHNRDVLPPSPASDSC